MIYVSGYGWGMFVQTPTFKRGLRLALSTALALAVCQVMAAPDGTTANGQAGPIAPLPSPISAPALGSTSLPPDRLELLARMSEQMDQARQVVNATADDLLSNAMGFLGVPYKRGGNSIETGFDCSGFVVALYKQSLGLVLPRTAAEQAQSTQVIAASDLKPGDLVFFNTMRRAFSHVGVYLGDGKFIHAPRTGFNIRVEDMGVRYWQTRFDGARRVPGPTSLPSTTATTLKKSAP
jgi:cell wall-associated NlpC family hydrolase